MRNEFCLISEVIFDRLSHHHVCLTLGKFLSWASKKARGLNALMKPINILSASRCATRGVNPFYVSEYGELTFVVSDHT